MGVENASHAAHYTAANASHIKILLREDNLGLGAKIGGGNAETFGLSLFSGVLGRLNGKSDAEVEKQQGALRDAELRNYQVQKYGLMKFVSGGHLVGDTIKPLEQLQVGVKRKRPIVAVEESRSSGGVKKNDEVAAKERKVRKQSKQSKLKDLEEDSSASRKEKKRAQREREESSQQLDTESRPQSPRSGDKKSRKKRTKHQQKDVGEISTGDDEPDQIESKQEKRARKEARRKRKDEKRRLKALKESAESSGSERRASHSEGTSTPGSHANRHAVRRRYIDQKRMSSLNPQAMKEIFMLKATA